jgi:GAF domain-containing protein
MPFQPVPELIKALQAIAEDLFETTSPARVTIRVDTTNDRDYPVLAEARAPGINSLTGGMTLLGYKPYDIHTTTTMRALKNDRATIVQTDARIDPPAIPQLVDLYGCAGQILEPIEHGGRFVGVVSVHSVAPRAWTDADIAAVAGATARVEQELANTPWIDLPSA